MSERILLTGVAGVGKTEIGERLASITGLPLVNLGTALLEEAWEDGWVGDRDDLLSMDPDDLSQYRNRAASRILGDPLILDTHLTVRSAGKFVPAIPESLKSSWSCTRMVILEAKPEEIIRRRAHDSKRHRNIPSGSLIKRHQSYNREVAQELARCWNCELQILDTTGANPGNISEQIATSFS